MGTASVPGRRCADCRVSHCVGVFVMTEARARRMRRTMWLLILVAFSTGGATYAVQVVYGLPWIPSLGLAMYAGGVTGILGGFLGMLATLYDW